MTLRPVPARWFELLVARGDLSRALEALARTGATELEQREERLATARLPDFSVRIEEFRRLAARYHPYWPTPAMATLPRVGYVGARLEESLARVVAWRDAADPVIQELDALRAEADVLALVADLLATVPEAKDLVASLAAPSDVLAARLFLLPADANPEVTDPRLLYRAWQTPTHHFGFALGEPAALPTLEQELVGLKARALTIPASIRGPAATLPQRLVDRRIEIAHQIRAREAQLDAFNQRFALANALAELMRGEWFLAHVGLLPVSENFAWVTGWTDDVSGRSLREAMVQGQVRGVLRFPPPPDDKSPPVVMFNPRWVRPFELFARLLGTPARDEADPSLLLAVIAPLLFGYMFGDVGHGLVLLLIGLWLQRRMPAGRLLVAGGIASIAFGFLFGSIFNMERLPPLWLRPLEQPLLVLAIPLAGGVGLLLLGLVLNAIEALWRGAGLHWLRSDAAILALYVTLLALFFVPTAAWFLPPLLAWYFLGAVAEGDNALSAIGHALTELLENLMQLAVNTLSFSRVGAFALAHGGLGLAVVQLAESTGNRVAFALILILGNIIVIALEGLVVAIQTTRLILFEFFIRFYRGGGRVFHPLTAPLTTPRRAS